MQQGIYYIISFNFHNNPIKKIRLLLLSHEWENKAQKELVAGPGSHCCMKELGFQVGSYFSHSCFSYLSRIFVENSTPRYFHPSFLAFSCVLLGFFIFIRRIFQKNTQATRNEASKQVFLTPSPAPPVTPEVGAHVEGYLCVGGAEQERLPVKSPYHTSWSFLFFQNGVKNFSKCYLRPGTKISYYRHCYWFSSTHSSLPSSLKLIIHVVPGNAVSPPAWGVSWFELRSMQTECFRDVLWPKLV